MDILRPQSGGLYVAGAVGEEDLQGEVLEGWELESTPIEAFNVRAISAGLLFAGLLKDINERPISHLAVGTGPAAYDIGDPPEAVANTRLVAELDRASLLFTNYVDGSGDPTIVKTNTVDLTFKFDTGEAVGTLVEMGLFGSTGADVANGGIITNYKAFAPFAKPSDRIMYVTWRIRFNI